VVVLLLLAVACKKAGSDDHPEPASAAPSSSSLPPLVVKPDTPNLLLTWIDEKGDFHVVQKPSDVPATHRARVRVVVIDKPAGTADLVYVASLDETAPDGSYRLETMSRAAWDELGASLRKERLEALAPSAAPPPSSTASPAGPGQAPNPAKKVVAIIYGASWCKPCHAAADYLRGRGVTVIMKDIEASEAAQAEMQQKLARSGRGGASIPVIDIMGEIMIGYSPSALDQAIRTAENSKSL